MLTYAHSKVRDELELNLADLQHHTRDVKVTTPGLRAVQHFVALMTSQYGKGASNSTRGNIWEACIYDAVVAYGIENGVNVECEFNVDTVEGKHAEVDLVFHATPYSSRSVTTHVLVKTSMRERWQQMDRTAILAAAAAGVGAIPEAHGTFGVFISEKVGDVRWPIQPNLHASAVKKAEQTQACCYARNLQIISALDEASMRRMLDTIIGVL